ncbi:hypothetical protein K1719_016851 [Acacia pycnantha]|nr:hypothetical protein K1719_016851 [Acacia pycnantha]
MIKLIVWNSRGAAKKGFAAVLKDIKFRYKVDLVVILEPRISGPQASKIIKGWGFRNWVRMEANGFSGGLWIMWEREDLKVEVLEANEQFIHCNLWVGVERVLFSAIYASPNDQKRRELWETLQGLAADIVEPWFLTESKGPFFTWKGPKWEDLDRVYKKLDRCLCNVSWLEKYENAEARILPRIHSDHHPVLVNLLGETQSAGPRNFRFQIMWQMHEKFNEVLQQSWIGNDDVHKKLVTLKQDLVVWNKEVLAGKYGRQHALIKECKATQADSELWKSLARLWPKMVENTCWEVGNGENLSFWNDKWLEGGRQLKEMCLGELSEIDKGLRVADMVDAEGNWNLGRVADKLNTEGKHLLLAVLPPSNQMGRDKVRWGPEMHNSV